MLGRCLAGLKNSLDPFIGNPVAEKVRHAANKNIRRLLFLRRVAQTVFVEGRGETGRERKNGAGVVLEGLFQNVKPGGFGFKLFARHVHADVSGKAGGLALRIAVFTAKIAAGDRVP